MPEKKQIKPSALSVAIFCDMIKWTEMGKMKIKQMSCHFSAFSSAPPSCQIGTKCSFSKFTVTYNNSDELH